MDPGRNSYDRKRGYSRVHVLTWTIYLEKNGFVPCAFQNCNFMAFSIVEMKNHFSTCKGEGFQAAYECKYCKGRTEHGEKLEEHIVRFHGQEADSTKMQTNSDIDSKRSKEPDKDEYPAMCANPKISKVVICSWDVSKEMYGYIKCPDCCLLCECVEEMKSHHLNCQKNPSAFAYECSKCNGRVVSKTALNHHMFDCHKDVVLEDDAFLENYSHFWKEQIDNCGFAKCSGKCTFIHADCSIMKKHLKDSCSMEAGCQSVIYCSFQSCSVWSTSRTALLNHKIHDHKLKTSDLIEGKIAEEDKQQNCKIERKGKLADNISENLPPGKCVAIVDSQDEGGIDSFVRCLPTETEVHGLNSDGLQSSEGCEADSDTGFLMALNSESTKRQYLKKQLEKNPRNDDPYQLLSSSDIENEITIDDPLTTGLDGTIRNQSWGRDCASNKIMAREEGLDENTERDEICNNNPLSPEIKRRTDKTRKCYSKMAKQNHLNNSDDEDVEGNSKNEDIEQTIELEIKDDTEKRDFPFKNSSSSKHRTYNSSKNYGNSEKDGGNFSSSGSGTESSDRGVPTNDAKNLNHEKDDGKLKVDEEIRISGDILIQGTIIAGEKSLINSSNNINDSTDEKNETFNFRFPQKDYSMNRNKRGSPRKEIFGVVKDLRVNPTSEAQAHLKRTPEKVSSNSEFFLDEIGPISTKQDDSSNIQGTRGISKKVSIGSDLLEKPPDVGSTSPSQKEREIPKDGTKVLAEQLGGESICTLQKKVQEETEKHNKNHSDTETYLDGIGPITSPREGAQNITLNNKKKRGRPRKISSNLAENDKKVVSTSSIPGDIHHGTESCKEMTCELGEQSEVEAVCPKPQEIQEERKISIEMRSGALQYPRKRGRPRKYSYNSENMKEIISTVPMQEDIQDGKQISSLLDDTQSVPFNQKKLGKPGKIRSSWKENDEKLDSAFPIQEEIQDEGVEEQLKNNCLDTMRPNCPPHEDNLNASLTNQRKRGRPRKISCILGKNVEGLEASCLKAQEERKTPIGMSSDTINELNEIRPTSSSHESTPNIPVQHQRKRGRPRKNSLGENLKEVVATFPTQENIQDGKQISKEEANRKQTEYLEKYETTCPEPEKNKKGIATSIAISDDTKNFVDDIRSISSSLEDSPSVSFENQKNSGSPRKMSKKLEDGKESFEEVPRKLGKVGSTCPKPMEIEGEKRPIEMSSDTSNYRNKIEPISSSSTPNNTMKTQKKRGRPRKNNNNLGKNVEEVVLNFRKQENIQDGKDISKEMPEKQKDFEVDEPTCPKPEEIQEKIVEDMIFASTKQFDKRKLISSLHEDSSNNTSKYQKKRGRPRKIERKVDEIASTFPIKDVLFKKDGLKDVSREPGKQIKENESTCCATVVEVEKKRGEPVEMSSTSNVMKTIPILGESRKLQNISSDQVEHFKEVGSTSPSSSQIKKKRGRPRKNNPDLGKHLEEKGSISLIHLDTSNSPSKTEKIRETTEKVSCDLIELGSSTITHRDSPNFPLHSQEKRGTPKKLKLSLEEPLENSDSQVKNCKLSLGSVLQSSSNEESKNYVDDLLNQQTNDDSCGKFAIDVDCNKPSISTAPEQSIKRKRGRPKKTQSALIVPSQPCNEPCNADKTPKRNILKPKKFAQYVTEDSFFEANESLSDESVFPVQGISATTDQFDESSVSSIPNSNNKKRRGRPKKTQASNLDVDTDYRQSFNESEIKSEKNVQFNRKRTISKPKKLSSYITENSDLEEALGHDEGELLSDIPGSSAIADRSEDSLQSNVVPQILKRKPGRPKKSSITALDVSIDAEHFNSSLETKQNLCSTPSRSLERPISKPKKYKGYVEEPLLKSRRTSSASNELSETQDVSEDFTVPKEGTPFLPGKHKISSRLTSDDILNPDIKAKIRRTSNAADETIDMTVNESDVGTEKNDGNSSVDSSKPREIITTHGKRGPPKRFAKTVTCTICKKSMTKFQFEIHAYEHNYFCWIEGDVPYDFEKEEDIHRVFFQARKFKSFRGFKCEKCGVCKKSSVGFLSHKSMCGISDLERENLKVPCPVCRRSMLPSSLKVHMGTDHRPNTKVAIGEVTSEPSKRAAAARAESRLEEEILDLSDSEETNPKKMRNWYTKKRKETFSNILMRWKLDLDKNNELVCSETNCLFKTDGLDTMQAHHSKCSNFNREYECRICGTRVKELLEMKEHILTKHAQVIANDCSDYEYKKESGSEEETAQQQLQQNTIQGKPNFVKSEYHRTGLSFIYRNMQRTHDRLQANHVEGRSLYEDFLAVPNGFLNEDELAKFLPDTPVSMKFSLGTENWDQLKLMEARSTGESSFVFVGGPVWAMDWCPVPHGGTHQWLAVSCHRDMDAVHNMGEVFSYDNAIQIWDFGMMNLCGSSLQVPTLSVGIAHSYGTAWDVRWCPDGCHQPNSERLGLLAVAFSSGVSVIYSVPLVTTDKGKPFYKLTPVVELTPPYEEPVQCCRIAWSSDCPFNIVAVGYMDGSIALYDITTSSLLLKDGIKIQPYKVFTAHSECITALQFIGNKNGKTLMSSSMDRSLKFWNLLDTSAPISAARKIAIRDALWLNNWLCAVSVNDDGCTNGTTHLSLNNFRDYLYLQTIPWISLKNSQWSISASEWSNAIAIASETGEIVSLYPGQLFYIDVKAIKRTTSILATTILKKLVSEEDQDQEREKLETNGPCNYKDATENYGLVLSETGNQGAVNNSNVKEKRSKLVFPITSVNKISYNPNRQAFTYLALGHQCGIVRVIRDNHFDFAKEEISNFSNSLLLR